MVAMNARACRESVFSFISHDPKFMEDADLAVAQMKLIPYYIQECPRFAEYLEQYRAAMRQEDALRLSL